MNRVVKTLIAADVALITGIGFITPVFAIFIADSIQGGNAQVAGFAAAIYWIVKAIFVIPFGKYIDRTHGEKDDFYFIVVGQLFAAAAVFGYLFASLPWHVYALQTLYGIGIAMNVPGYTAVFTRHIDHGREAFDWSVHSSLVGFGAGASGAIGGWIANQFGFTTLFIVVGAFLVIASFIPLLIYQTIAPKQKKVTGSPPPQPFHHHIK